MMGMTEDGKVLTMQLDGSTKKGRPKPQWTDDVSNDAKLFGVMDWRAITSYRDH